MTKDSIDIGIRILTLLAVSIPVILFYFQQRAERKKQTALLQINMFSEISTKIHSLLFVDTIDKSHVEIANTLVYDNFQKVSFLINDSVKKKLRSILFDLTAYTSIINIINQYDSLRGSMIKDLSNKIMQNSFDKNWRDALQKIDKEKTLLTHGQTERFYTSTEIKDSAKGVFKSEEKFFNPIIENLEQISKAIRNYIDVEVNYHEQWNEAQGKNDEDTKDRLENAYLGTGHAYTDIEFSIMEGDPLNEDYKKYIREAMEDLDRTFYETTNQYFRNFSLQ